MIVVFSVQGYGQQNSESESWFYPGSGRSRDNAIEMTDPFFKPNRDEMPFQPEIDFDEGQKFPRIINVGIGPPGDKTELWKQCWREKVDIAMQPFQCDFRQLQILPVVVDFCPDLILLSAGFDAHRRDDINGGFISLESHHYEWLTRKLTEVANK